jgi:hypothetical protein
VQRRPPGIRRSIRGGPATAAEQGERQREAAASFGRRTRSSRSTMQTTLHEIGRRRTKCEGWQRGGGPRELSSLDLRQRASQEQRTQRGGSGGGGVGG